MLCMRVTPSVEVKSDTDLPVLYNKRQFTQLDGKCSAYVKPQYVNLKVKSVSN